MAAATSLTVNKDKLSANIYYYMYNYANQNKKLLK